MEKNLLYEGIETLQERVEELEGQLAKEGEEVIFWRKQVRDAEARNRKLGEALTGIIAVQSDYATKTGMDHPGNSFWAERFMAALKIAREAREG